MEGRPTPPSLLYCDVCNIQSSSEGQHRAHLLGKRHWANQRGKDEALKSVYVRGFHSNTTEKDLHSLFSSFGIIHKIVLDLKGIYAIVEFSCIESALKVLHHSSPIELNGAVLKIRQREYKPRVMKKHMLKGEEGIEEMYEEEEPPKTKSVKLPLNEEQIKSLISENSVDSQISLVISLLCLPPSSLQSHFDLLHRLKSYFSPIFPSCQVVPFGSLVTGLATPTSDMDVTLLTNWTLEDEKNLGSCLLLPSSELKQNVDPEVEDMETSGSSGYLVTTPPPLAESLTAFSLPSNIKCIGGHNLKDWSNEYKGMLRVLGNVSEFRKILAISTARCPIVRFTDSITGINCDVSVDNRLGLYNSKLLKSYLEFEPRLPPIVFFLRQWFKSCLPEVNLSNYALIVMVIHCLQHATPPLLPCLQQQGPWPRNMAWFGTMGFTGEITRDMISSNVDGWKVSLINHQSLLPSSDKRTLGELLHHFFHYYSSVFPFSTHSVTIHSYSNTIKSKDEASEIATRCAPPDLPFKQRSLKLSCLTIQDPLELTHNISKNISPKSLDIMKHSMSSASDTMETLLHSEAAAGANGILSLFGSSFTPSAQSNSMKGKNSRILDFDKNTISNVFQKVPDVSELVGVEIGLASHYVREKLATVVLKALVFILETELGFTCVPVTREEYCSTPTTPSQQVYMTTSMSTSLTEPVKPVSLVKRLRNDKDHGVVCDNDGDVIEEKRVRVDSDPGCCTSVTALIESHSLLPGGHGFYPPQVNCTVTVNTWTHRRRFRRQQEGIVSVSPAIPLGPPVLQFTMSCVPPTDTVPEHSLVSIEFCVHPHEDFVTEFQTFFAYFKKFLLHS